MLNKLKQASHRSLTEILQTEDEEVRDIIRGAFAGKRMELFRENCRNAEILQAVENAVRD